MHGHPKRRRSKSRSETKPRKAMKGDAEDQKLPDVQSGSFQVETELRSQSKAKRNDPKSARSFEESLGEASKRFGAEPEARNVSADKDGKSHEGTSMNNTNPSEQTSLPQSGHPSAISSRSSDAVSGNTSEGHESDEDLSEQDFDADYSDAESPCGSEYDEFAEFKWLEQMDGKVLWTSAEASEPVKVGYCSGKLIRRSYIRGTFHEDMEEPSTDTSALAFELFDRYGRLKSEFKTHPVKKGSGVWQDEFDEEDLLLIDYIYLEPQYRRQGLGRRLLTDMLKKVERKTGEKFYAVIKPGALTSECDKEMGDVGDEARIEFYDQARNVAEVFWRSFGFRRIGSLEWFGLASDPGHACHRLKMSDDYQPPGPKACELDPVYEAIQRTISTTEDDEYVEQFKQLSADMNVEHPFWQATDKDGNTLLHIAATSRRLGLLNWILQHPRGSNLLHVRNRFGETPLDALHFQLETTRTQNGSNSLGKIDPCSDKFEGFDATAVQCLAVLKGKPLAQLPAVDQERIAFGCTCGQCVAGFLSPRMSFALLCQAEFDHDSLRDCCDAYSGPNFVEWNEEELRYLEPSVRQNLTTNKSMRQGFVALFDCFATCLKNKVTPVERRIMHVMQNSNQWPPVSRNFLERGGTIYSVGSVIFEKARSQDLWAGDGDHWDVFQDEIQALPTCRNDHEFGFVSSMCGFKRISGIRHVNAFTGEEMDID